MTKINRLTQIPTLDDSDLAVVWQDSSERTRAITIANLRKFIQSTDPNADAFVKAELIGDELVLTSHDEAETRIDINILPSHSVTEFKDMPDELISGYYLKVNDAGTDFVLTPASEISAAIILEENGTFKGTANVINFDDLDVEITNKIARISAKPVGGSNGEIMKVEDGKLVPSGVMSNKDGSLSLSSGSVDIGPHTISSSGEGIEATNDSSGESYNFVFSGQGDDNGPVDRILGAESSIKTTEGLSLELTNHVSKLTATADVRIIKKPVTIKPVSSQTNVTMQVTDLNGSDIWTYGPFDMAIDANGDFKFIISTVLDFKVGEYLVTFLSPDGDVTLYGGVSPISGEQIVYGELPFKPFHDETLHNIKTGGEIIREIEAGENVTAEIVDGKLTISADGEELPENPTFKSVNIDTAGSGNPNFAASIHQDSELHTVIDATRELRIKYKDIGTGDTTTVAGIDNNQAQFLVPILQGVDPVALKKDIPDTDDFAKKSQPNTFTESQTINDAELKVKNSEGSSIFRVRPDNNTVVSNVPVTVNDKLECDELNTKIVNSPDSILNLKAYGSINISMGSEYTQIQKPMLFNKFVEFYDNALYYGGTTQPKNLMTKESSEELIAEDKAKGEWIGGVFKDTINDDGNPGDDFTCNDPKHFLEYRKKTFQGDYALTVIQGDTPISSDITIHLHPESGMYSAPFKVVTSDGKEITKTIRMNEKWRFYLRKSAFPYCERIDDGTSGYILEDQFNAKSGYSALESGGGSTKTVTYADNGKILKLSHSTVKVEMLGAMNSDTKKHGYFKYINSRNSDVAFEWYDRTGSQVTNNVPSVCPANAVVEIFADYEKDQYVLNFGQSKVIQSVNEDDELMEGLASGVIYAKTVTIG